MTQSSNITLIETSIQYEKLKTQNYLKKRKIASKDTKVRSSYFVLYEYKSGLIRNLIDYYLTVKILDKPSDAMVVWAEGFKVREVKNRTLLHGLIMRLEGTIKGEQNTGQYLAQLEAAIEYAINVFHEDIDKWKVGHFRSDPIIEYQIHGVESYKEFLKLHTDRKAIPMTEFWTKKDKQLRKILKNKNNAPTKYIKKFEQLEEVAKDKTVCDKKITLNNALGDPVICVDTPMNYILATTDGYQIHLREVLSGKCILVERAVEELKKKLKEEQEKEMLVDKTK